MSTDITVKSFSASADQAQTLGTATTRWGTVYAKEINDGEGGAIQVADVPGALEFAIEKNHGALTAESRAAENSHPVSAITGLTETLQPATQASAGLMSPGDKAKIDNITPDRIVYATSEGNIRLPNSKKLLGTSLGGEEHNLIELNQLDQVDVGDSQHALNLRSSARPTVQVGSESGSEAESIAFLSDISRPTSWDVDTVDNLVTLTEAQVGDVARIITGEDAGDVYQLIAADPIVLANWLNITRDGGVIAVNGKIGAVEVDLVDFPGVQTALNEKANLASPVFAGTPRVPYASINSDSTQIANTSFVKTNLANYLPLAGGTLTSTLTLPRINIANTFSSNVPYIVNNNNNGYLQYIADVAHRWYSFQDGVAVVLGFWTSADLYIGTDSSNRIGVKTEIAKRLPLAGGTMSGVLSFSNGVMSSPVYPNKVDVYNGSGVYGIGLEAQSTTYHSLTNHRWYLGAANAQTLAMYLNTTDLYIGSTGVITTLSAKASLASPTFTGTPKAPTAAAGTSTTQVATTEFVSTAIAANKGAIVGEIRMLPFRASELPTGWYYPSGDYFELTSTVGKALNALPENYKADWGIVISGTTIRLFDPEKFFAADGGSNTVGRFFRPVDGSARLPGSTEDDAIRNITGSAVVMSAAQTHSFTGAFTNVGTGLTYTTGSGTNTANYGITLNASRTVPTASENRPFNVGLTPAVYLGAS